MASFRKEILGQIERIDTGRIFTFRDLSFETEKTANVAVLLSEQSRKGVLVRVEKEMCIRDSTCPKRLPAYARLPVRKPPVRLWRVHRAGFQSRLRRGGRSLCRHSHYGGSALRRSIRRHIRQSGGTAPAWRHVPAFHRKRPPGYSGSRFGGMTSLSFRTRCV